MKILLTLFITVWIIYFLQDVYKFYRDYFFKNIKRENISFYMLKTVFFLFSLMFFYRSFDVERHDKEHYGKEELQKQENLLGVEWGKGTVVIPSSKKIREEKITYIKPIHEVNYHNIPLLQIEVESYIPAINKINFLKVKLAHNSDISNFPCSKDRRVKILSDGMLIYCELYKDITIEGVKVQKGSSVKLLNINNGAHPTFEMTKRREYDSNKSFVPIWKISGSSLEVDTNISGIDCLKGSAVSILDNGKLVFCSDSAKITLEDYSFEDGCSVSNINPLQGKIPNLLDVWDFSCKNVKIEEMHFDVLNLRYFPHKNKIINIDAKVNINKKHTLEDLLKGGK